MSCPAEMTYWCNVHNEEKMRKKWKSIENTSSHRKDSPVIKSRTGEGEWKGKTPGIVYNVLNGKMDTLTRPEWHLWAKSLETSLIQLSMNPLKLFFFFCLFFFLSFFCFLLLSPILPTIFVLYTLLYTRFLSTFPFSFLHTVIAKNMVYFTSSSISPSKTILFNSRENVTRWYGDNTNMLPPPPPCLSS